MGLIRGDRSRQRAGCSLCGVVHPWRLWSCFLGFPMLRVPGDVAGDGTGQGSGQGPPKSSLPVDVSLSRMGNSSLVCSAGKHEQPGDPKESLEWGLSCSTLGIWDEFPHGKTWNLHCPGAAPPPCFPPLPSSSSLPKPWVNLTRKLPTLRCQSSTLSSNRIWPLEHLFIPKTPQIQG